MIDATMQGIEETRKQFQKYAKGIEGSSEETLMEVGQLGWNYAQNLVPKNKGFLSQALINFPENSETWLIVSAPPADHPQFPLNIAIDDAKIGWLNWGSRTSPKTGQFGFMRQTADFLEKEFAERLNLKITRALQ